MSAALISWAWRCLPLAIGALIAVFIHAHGAHGERVKAQAAMDAAKANHATELQTIRADLATAEAEARRQVAELIQRQATELAKVNDDATHKIDDANRARGAADRVAGSLREQARNLAAACRADGPKAASPASDGQAAANPAMVLADLFGRADARAGELAALADRRGIAGAACERAGEVKRLGK